MVEVKPCPGCGQEPVVNSRHQLVDRHDCGYVRRVNALAELAAEQTPEHHDGDYWDAAYHRRVDWLRAQAGLVMRRAER